MKVLKPNLAMHLKQNVLFITNNATEIYTMCLILEQLKAISHNYLRTLIKNFIDLCLNDINLACKPICTAN